MNANIELATIELESIIKHTEFIIAMYKKKKSYAVTIPAHMHVSISDVLEFISKGMKGLKRDLAIVEATYISKRITAIISGAVKGEHVSDVGLNHLINACRTFIDNHVITNS